MTDTYDVIVIGAGPPGENAAQYAVQGGLSAALIEAELVGGECSYWACMPSKALLRPIEVLATAQAVPGISVSGSLDVEAILARRDEFTAHLDDSSQVKWAEGVPIDVIRGHGAIAGVKSVVVTAADGTTRTLSARHAVVLGTGTVAAMPPIDGLASAEPWTSRDVTNLHEVPRRVLIMGGGVVACESAQWVKALGAEEVHIVEHSSRLISKMEPFASSLVEGRFKDVGINVQTGVKVVSVARGPVTTTAVGHPRGSEVTVTLDNGSTIVVDELVVAVGRTPVSYGIGLDVVGLPSKGFVSVDDHMTVTAVPGEWLYAVGDINGRALLTHQGKYQARVCGDVIAARAAGKPLLGRRFSATTDNGKVPQVAFTDPQVASVGLTVAAASEAGIKVDSVEFDLASVAGSALDRVGYAGRANLVIDTERDVLVGATFAGPEMSELLHSATVAVVGEVPIDVLWHAVPSYPTKSEVWLRLLETWRSRG